MATITEALFILQFLVIITIFILKFVNIMSVGKTYDLKIAFVLLVVFQVAFWLGILITFSDPNILTDTTMDVLLYGRILNFESFLLKVIYMFTFIEAIFWLKDSSFNSFKRD